MTFFRNLVTFTAILSLAIADGENFGATPDATACSFNNPPSQQGFDVRLYEYDYNSGADYNSDAYVDGGYLDHSLIGTSVITNFNAENDVISSGPIAGEVFGIQADVTNFTAELTSYFYAQENGYYTVQLDYIDDSVALYFASEGAFLCCTNREIPTTNTDFTYNILTSKDFYGPKDHEQYYYQYLEAGKYYPLKMLFTNIAGAYNLSLTINSPSGIAITTGNSGSFFTPTSADDSSSNCGEGPVSTVFQTDISSWTGSTSLLYTDYPYSPTEGVTVHIINPDPTATVSYVWTGLATSSDFATPTGAGTWTETLYIPRATDTEYIAWTGTVIAYSTTTPADINVHETIYIFTPDPRITITEIWKDDITSTTTFGGGSGSDDTVTVEIYTPRGTDTSTTAWDGNTISYSTIIPADLNEHVKVVEYTPEGQVSVTEETTTSATNNTSFIHTDNVNVSSTTVAAAEVGSITSEPINTSTQSSSSTYNSIPTQTVTVSNGTSIFETTASLYPSTGSLDGSGDLSFANTSSINAASVTSDQVNPHESSLIESYMTTSNVIDTSLSVTYTFSSETVAATALADSSNFEGTNYGFTSKSSNSGSSSASIINTNGFPSPSPISENSSYKPFISEYVAAASSSNNAFPSLSTEPFIVASASSSNKNNNDVSLSASVSIQTSFISSIQVSSIQASSIETFLSSPQFAIDYSNESNQKISFSVIGFFLISVFVYGLII